MTTISIHDLDSDSIMCVDKVSTDAYHGMLPVPDGSGRVFLWSKNGGIWLGSSSSGSRAPLRVQPFIDLSSRPGLRGLVSVAIHSSGAFFVSYVMTAAEDYVVVEELLAAASVDESVRADPSQARQVVAIRLSAAESMDLHGGQIFFRPGTDPFLYLVTGPTVDSPQKSQIVRLSVHDMPGTPGTPNAEVVATFSGFPSRCAFDSDTYQQMYCGDVEPQQESIINIIVSGGAAPATTTVIVAHRRAPGAAPSITGGLLYRGLEDRSFSGSYIYIHDSAAWVAVPSPESDTHYIATQISKVICSASTPFPCRGGGLGGAFFGEDGNKNAFLLAQDGVYRIAQRRGCHDDTASQHTITIPKWVFPLIGSILGTAGLLTCCKVCYCCNRISNRA